MRQTHIYDSAVFSLQMKQTDTQTNLTMQVVAPVVNTRHLPYTSAFLKRMCPNVLYTQCFNEKKYSFRKEVEATEIGHLFEHIVIDEMCMLKTAAGAKEVVFNGVTSWNWEKEAVGTFHIVIDTGKADISYLIKALYKGIAITESLYALHAPSHKPPAPISYHAPLLLHLNENMRANFQTTGNLLGSPVA